MLLSAFTKRSKRGRYSKNTQKTKTYTTTAKTIGTKNAVASSGILLAGCSAIAVSAYLLMDRPDAYVVEEPHMELPRYPWYHKSMWRSFDAMELRRGFQVFKQVATACHGLKYLTFVELVDAMMSEQEAREVAADFEVEDGPNDEGEMFMRECNLGDKWPQPYENVKLARLANDGANPPDLTHIIQARIGGENYIFSLLTGYMEPPVGVTVLPGMFYNPYMEGGLIKMPPPLIKGMVEYEDGTEASISQMAKDVSAFLYWCREPKQKKKHRLFLKAHQMLIWCAIIPMFYIWRSTWLVVHNRRVVFMQHNAWFKKPTL